jgi:hypothetical protein
MHACIHTYIHTHIYMHACIHTYIHTYTHIHTYIHTHTHTLTLKCGHDEIMSSISLQNKGSIMNLCFDFSAYFYINTGEHNTEALIQHPEKPYIHNCMHTKSQ